MYTSVAVSVLAVGRTELSMLVLIVVLGIAVALVKALAPGAGTGRAPTLRHRRSTPTPFSYWYALVPFEDTNGAKERPVLVLGHDGTYARVLKVTSKAKPGRTNYRRINTSRWDRPGFREGSWLKTDTVVTVPLSEFRRHLGNENNPRFTNELARIHPDEVREPSRE